MHRLLTLLSVVGWLVWLTSCNKDDEGLEVGKGGLEADPSLNQMVYTSMREHIYALDPATGESRLLASLAENNYVENVLEYHNGILYAVSESNGLYAFDAQSGQLLWKKGLPDFKKSSINKTHPVFYDNKIFVAGLRGIMMALDATTGNTIWQFDFKVESDYYKNMYGKPALYGDYLLYGTLSGLEDNYLVCLNNQTGKLQWVVPLEGDGVKGRTVVVSDDIVYVPGEHFEARSLESGELIWSFPTWEHEGASQPVVAGDKILFNGAIEDSPFYAKLYCLDKRSGELIWEVETGYNDAVGVSPKVAGSFVFGFYQEAEENLQLRGRPFAVSLETGEQIWKNENITVRALITYANGRLIFPGFNRNDDHTGGSIICLDAATGDIIWDNKEAYYPSARIAPIVVAQNGVFKP